MKTIKERVIQIIEFKGIIKENFFTKIGMTSANFRSTAKKTPLNSTAIENILSEIPDANPEWLLTGKGEMLKADAQSAHPTSALNGSAALPTPPTMDERLLDLVSSMSARLEKAYDLIHDKDKTIDKLHATISNLQTMNTFKVDDLIILSINIFTDLLKKDKENLYQKCCVQFGTGVASSFIDGLFRHYLVESKHRGIRPLYEVVSIANDKIQDVETLGQIQGELEAYVQAELR